MEPRTQARPDQASTDDRVLLSRLVGDRGPLDVTKTISYVLHALEEVCEAHERQLVHCHLRPENLILGSGRVKVLGFENAKKKDGPGPESPASTGAGVLDTEPHYMSPEQIGAPATVDARSDVWSLGATAFFLLTGRPPFVGENDYVVTTQILVEDAPRVTSLRAAVAPRLDQIIARCLTRNRDERFQTAAQLRDALESLQRDMARRFDATLRSPEEMAEARAGFPPPPVVEIYEPPTQKFDTTAPIVGPPRPPKYAMPTGETKRIERPNIPDDGPTDIAPREATDSKGGTLLMPPIAPRAISSSGAPPPYSPSGAPPAMPSGPGMAIPPAMSSGMLPPSGSSGAWPSLSPPPAAASARNAPPLAPPRAPPRGGLVAFVIVTLVAIVLLALGTLRYLRVI